MLIAHLLPLLAERGLGQSLAVMAAMLIGPMQVVGRFIFMQFEHRTPSDNNGIYLYGRNGRIRHIVVVCQRQPALNLFCNSASRLNMGIG